MGIYGDNAMKYFERGITTLPVIGKGGLFQNWNQYCTQPATEEEIEAWSESSADHNICLPCGPANNLLVLDFDEENPDILTEILAVAQPSPVVRFGAKGEARFYRCFDQTPRKEKISRRNSHDGKLSTVVEIFYNMQVVIPPSIHPDTKAPYKWLSEDTLLDIDLEDLPIYDPSQEKKFIKIASKYDLDKSSKSFAGRNDSLVFFATKLITKRTPISDAIYALVEYDQKTHEKPLFSDTSEIKSMNDVFGRALILYSNVYKTLTRDGRSFVPHDLVKTGRKYPNRSTGFFKLDEKKKQIPQYHELSEYFVHELKYLKNESGFYKFNGCYYERIGEDFVKHEINEKTNFLCETKSIRSNFLDVVSSLGSTARFDLPTSGLLNLRNGILDVKTKTLKSHSSDYFFTSVVDVNYDASAMCPNWLAMLERVFPGDADSKKLLQQFFAYVLWGGDPVFHKALCLIGEGANGKSTILKTLQAILGPGSYSSISMTHLDKPFQMINIKDKLANIVEETPSSDAIDSEAFKNAVGGGNVSMSYKFKDEISEPVRARLIFSCNETPRFKDSTHGLRRRLLFLPFEQDFSGSNTKHNIWKEEIEPELSGILNWCLELLPIDKSWRFVEPQSSIDAMHEYKMDQDPIYVFVNDRLEYTGKVFDTVTPDEIYRAYESWAFNEGYNKLNKRWLMRKVIMNLVQKHKMNKNDLYCRNHDGRFLSGIRLI